MIATPPISLPKRSCNFSFSNGEVAPSIWVLISSALNLIASSSPLPSTIVVLSLPTIAERAEPNTCFKVATSILSNLWPLSLDNTWPPVITAKSSNAIVLLSPNSGALTAATFTTPLALLTIVKAKASPSISSATINNALVSELANVNTFTNSFTLPILPL